MCTDHQRNGHHHDTITPTITRVPLARIAQPSRWTRRRLLVNGGLGTASMAILAACGSGGATSATATTTPTTSQAETGETPTTAAAESADAAEIEEPTEESAPIEESSSGLLQLQHVSLGFVSAYVLVRGSEAAIVDTGVSGSGEAINTALTDLGLGPTDVRHIVLTHNHGCLLYTSPSPRDRQKSRMPSSA